MSKLEELIEELCPDGVEYKELGSVVNYEQPTKYIVSNTDYSDDFSIPVLTAGQSLVLGYTNETEGLYNASKEKPVIIFDDFTGMFKWVDFPFKVKSSAMKMLTADEEKTTLRYIFHVMCSIGFTSDKHKRLWISTYSVINIPLPPLRVQCEIVRILDNFMEFTTELTTKLTTELTARKKQYEYYRDTLFTFYYSVEKKILNNIARISRGVRVIKKQLNDDGIYPVYQNCLTPMGYYDKYNCKANTTYIISAGAAGEIGYSNVEFWAADDCLVFSDLKGVINKYIYYFLQTKQDYIRSNVRKASIPRLSRTIIEKLEIPFPPLSEQKRIVELLEHFESLCSDLSTGLPAEIAARQKQYEYYRDKLLTFKELS